MLPTHPQFTAKKQSLMEVQVRYGAPRGCKRFEGRAPLSRVLTANFETPYPNRSPLDPALWQWPLPASNTSPPIASHPSLPFSRLAFVPATQTQALICLRTLALALHSLPSIFPQMSCDVFPHSFQDSTSTSSPQRSLFDHPAYGAFPLLLTLAPSPFSSSTAHCLTPEFPRVMCW